jgi:RNA polymerase sigma-70 factor (ECF subfamily)
MPGERADDDLTQWLKRMSAGDGEAAEHVASAVYQELRRLAASVINRENRYHSLQPTLLVNEAFLTLIKGQPIEWQDRKHFFSLACRMMRRIVVDYFRNQNAQRRPPRRLQLSIEDVVVFSDDRRDEALIVDEALDKLFEVDPRAAKVVELRYFAGLTIEQTAELLGVTDRTVKRDWEMAQWWLKRYFESKGKGKSGGAAGGL